ncbi:hypothetical protein GGX14DRAFT_657766 [Mycena pura]|uniref:Uncharacterized protein n=1 Tax=Mycena pura TaxID=153505 RepID=A0AAD6YLW3_9AGAR|nr:hypothetical protein GGX14DRAFT_657766 [Mycena pura]
MQSSATTTQGTTLPSIISPVQRPLRLTDALEYLVAVKKHTRPEIYKRFLDILGDFRSQACDIPATVQRVSRLFRRHPHLIQGFNIFVPFEYSIDVPKIVKESRL